MKRDEEPILPISGTPWHLDGVDALRENSFRLELALEASDLGWYDYCPLTGELAWDERCRAMWGVGTHEPVTVTTFFQGLHPADAVATLEALDAALDADRRRRYDLEFRVRPLDGSSERWVRATGKAVFEGEGSECRAVRFVGTMQDVTDRKHAEEALRESDAHLRELSRRLTYHVENSPLAVIEWGPDMRLIRWSGEAERLFGWRADEVLGKRMEDFRWIYAEDAEHVDDVSTDLKSGANPRSFSANRNYRKDGTVVHCEWYNSSLLDDSGNLRSILSLVLDVTARKVAEEALALETANLKALNEDLEAFSYSVSHDLRAPLRAINGFAAMLEEVLGPHASEEARRYAGLICENSSRMDRLIDDLLAFSKLSRSQVCSREVDVDFLVREAWHQHVQGLSERNLELRVGELPPASGDPHLLRQVFANLLDNAIKYTPSSCAGAVCVGALESQSEHVYFVRDTGIGFDMEYVDRIFEVFQRLHGSREIDGTGVGLATVKRIMQRHCGRVWAESSVGQGSTFYIAWPRQALLLAQPNRHHGDGPPAGDGGRAGTGPPRGSPEAPKGIREDGCGEENGIPGA